MNVDFNNLRLQAMISYDKLAEILNVAVDEDNPNGQSEVMIVEIQDIQEHMDDLKQYIGAIGMIVDSRCPELIDVYAKEYTAKNTKMIDYNPENKPWI